MDITDMAHLKNLEIDSVSGHRAYFNLIYQALQFYPGFDRKIASIFQENLEKWKEVVQKAVSKTHMVYIDKTKLSWDSYVETDVNWIIKTLNLDTFSTNIKSIYSINPAEYLDFFKIKDIRERKMKIFSKTIVRVF